MQKRASEIGGVDGGLSSEISRKIWHEKYRAPADQTIEDTWSRVANALAAAEPKHKREEWAKKFYWAMEGFKYLPGGRTISSAGTGRSTTSINCYVMGVIPDSIDGIFSHLREAAITAQQGGGIGMDFSSIRHKGAHVKGVDAEASGPLSFMDVWDSMCRTMLAAGARRGAMMATLRCDHPDIEAFIEAKRDPAKLRMFNCSVLVTDAFMDAVKADKTWRLQFGGEVCRTLPARELWEKILLDTYEHADPGVIFIDRINAKNNLRYCEEIYATNPCGEEPLPPYGACVLGSINLAALVENPFTKEARIPAEAISNLVPVAVRMLDNVIDTTNFPLSQQEQEAKNKRRVGLGITGLADALAMCGLHYGTQEARIQAARWMDNITAHAYAASMELAKEKGAFPLFDSEKYGKGAIGASMNVSETGIRNSHLISIAPTGTISLLAGNVSGGIEPIFDLEYERNVLNADGSKRAEKVQDYAYAKWLKLTGGGHPPPEFVTAHDLTPEDHLLMQAALQPYVDSSISKTINCPDSISFDDFKDIYERAYDLGLKGCTTFRPNDNTGSILVKKDEKPKAEVPATIAQISPRPDVMAGSTYKLKWFENSLYVTINCRNGKDGRPFEIFVNSRNPEITAWTTPLCRMISAIWRHDGDKSFIIQELKEIHDARGGSWIEGKYVPSLAAAIGGVIERHTGVKPQIEMTFATADKVDIASSLPVPRTFCSKCSSANVVKASGCLVCRDCGHSTCG